MRIVKRFLFIVSLWGTPNYYVGVDKPNIWQYLYKWRTSLKTAIKIDKILHSER